MKKIFTFFMLFLVTTFFTGCRDNNLVVDSENVIDLAQNYDYVYDFYDGFARVMKDNKCGVVNDKGNEIIPCKYDWIFIDDFYTSTGYNINNTLDLFITQENEKYGFIDKTGKEVIECKYDDISYLMEGMVEVHKDGKWGAIAKTGKEVIECKYDYIGGFAEEMVEVHKDGKYGFIDKTGKEVVECKYDYVDGFSEGMAQVKKDGKYGFIDKTGKEVIECKYDDARSFSEGMARVEKDGKWRFIDKTGKKVVECKCDYVDSFKEGMAEVKKDGKWGFIDKTGKEVIECKYDYVDSFKEGMAEVKKDGKWGFINKTGKEVIEFKYDYTYSFSEGMAAVNKGGNWGFIDKTGKEVIECKYDWVGDFSKGMAKVEKDGKCYIINIKEEICNPNEIINQDSIASEDKTSNKVKSIVLGTNLFSIMDKDLPYNFMSHYTASSELVEGKTTYHAYNLGENYISSSWVEGVEGYGVGEKLEISIIEGCWVEHEGGLYAYVENKGDINKLKDYYQHLKGFWVVNGFAKNESLWKANSRVKKIKLTINNAKEYIVDLEDTYDIQYIEVDYKINNIVEPIKVVAEILEVYEGDKYEDTALSLFKPECETNIPWEYYYGTRGY